jgi:hypothetical protein
VSIFDPHGVVGTNAASGGDFPAMGIVNFSGGGISGLLRGIIPIASTVSCVLPSTKKGLCVAIMNYFQDSYSGSF